MGRTLSGQEASLLGTFSSAESGQLGGLMGVHATRVRRYGADRTEISRDDGTLLGWIDNITGEVHAESEQFILEIRTWIADRGER